MVFMRPSEYLPNFFFTCLTEPKHYRIFSMKNLAEPKRTNLNQNPAYSKHSRIFWKILDIFRYQIRHIFVKLWLWILKKLSRTINHVILKNPHESWPNIVKKYFVNQSVCLHFIESTINGWIFHDMIKMKKIHTWKPCSPKY